MTRLSSLITIIAFMVITVLSVNALAQSRDSHYTIRVGIDQTEPALHYLPFISAIENGYFNRAGIKVQVEKYGDNLIMIDDLKDSKIDFALCYPLFPAVAQEYNFPIKILGVLTHGTAYYGYTNNPELKNVDNLEKFKGKTLGIYKDTHPLTFHFTNIMRNSATLFEDIKVEHVKPKEQRQALDDKKLDVAIGVEPMLSQSLNEETLFRSFAYDDFMGQTAYVALSANMNRIERNPVAVKTFIDALNDAMVAFYTDRLIAVRMAQIPYPEYTYEQLKAPVTRLLEKDTFPQSLYLSKELWDNTLPALIESGYLLEKIKYEDVINNDYVRQP